MRLKKNYVASNLEVNDYCFGKIEFIKAISNIIFNDLEVELEIKKITPKSFIITIEVEYDENESNIKG